MKTIEIRRLNEMQHYGVLVKDIMVEWDTDFSGRYVLASEAAERIKVLEAALDNISIKGPDDDGLVWLIFDGKGTSGKGMLQIGKAERLVSQVAILFEEQRKAALEVKP